MGEIQDAKIPKAYRLTVRRRQAMLEYADLHGVRATARHFDLDRKTVRAWRACRRAVGVAGLVPRAPARQSRWVSASRVALVAHVRRTLQAGTTWTPVWLFRVHPGRLAQSTIQRLCRGRPPALGAHVQLRSLLLGAQWGGRRLRSSRP